MYSLLKHSKGFVGVHHNNSTYVVGFKCDKLARTIHTRLHEPSKNKLANFRNEYNLVLMDRINMYADLTMTKCKDVNETNYEIQPISDFELFSFPYDYNIGLALPIQMTTETDEEFVLETKIVDPALQPSYFRHYIPL